MSGFSVRVRVDQMPILIPTWEMLDYQITMADLPLIRVSSRHQMGGSLQLQPDRDSPDALPDAAERRHRQGQRARLGGTGTAVQRPAVARRYRVRFEAFIAAW